MSALSPTYCSEISSINIIITVDVGKTTGTKKAENCVKVKELGYSIKHSLAKI